MKRFQHTETIRNKIDSLVRFPHLENEYLDLSPFLSSSPSQPSNFELFAVSDHSGSLVSGHYTAVAKNIDVVGTEGEEGKVKKEKLKFQLKALSKTYSSLILFKFIYLNLFESN